MIKQVIRPALAASIGALALITNSRSAAAAIDPSAAEVVLRTSCIDNNTGLTINNCFTSVGVLSHWTWTTRNPTAASPLHVLIGPGSWVGGLNCTNGGYVTYSGAGAGNSILQKVTNNACTNLIFENLTVQAPSVSGTYFAVQEQGGLTTWKNVEIRGPGYTWFDEEGGCVYPAGQHYFYNSRIVATDPDSAGFNAAFAVYSKCDQLWFQSTELTSSPSIGCNLQTLHVEGNEVYFYGGSIRAVPGSADYGGADGDDAPAAVYAFGGEVNIHGASIEASATVPTNVRAIVTSGGVVDASGSSYKLETTGTIYRLWPGGAGGASVKAPYLWANDTTPPNIISQTGADMMVVTAGGTPRLVIYKDDCPSKWYDPHTTSCF